MVAANGTGERQIQIYKNGSSVRTYNTPTYASDVATVAVTETLKMLAGDYLQVYALQNSGGALALTGSIGYNVVTVQRIGN